MDQKLLNGNPKVTVIGTFNGEAILLGPGPSKRKKFESLDKLKVYIHEKGYEVSVSHIHPAGVGKGEAA